MSLLALAGACTGSLSGLWLRQKRCRKQGYAFDCLPFASPCRPLLSKPPAASISSCHGEASPPPDRNSCTELSTMTLPHRVSPKTRVGVLLFSLLYGGSILLSPYMPPLFCCLAPPFYSSLARLATAKNAREIGFGSELSRQLRYGSHSKGYSVAFPEPVHAVDLRRSGPAVYAPLTGSGRRSLRLSLLNSAKRYEEHRFLPALSWLLLCPRTRRGVLPAVGRPCLGYLGCPSFPSSIAATPRRSSPSLSVQHRQKQHRAAIEYRSLTKKLQNVPDRGEGGLASSPRDLLDGVGVRQKKGGTCLESFPSSLRLLSLLSANVARCPLRISTFTPSWLHFSQEDGRSKRNGTGSDFPPVGVTMSLCGTEETTRELNNQTTLKQKQDSTGDSGATVRETSHNVQPTASSFPVDPTSAPGKTEQYQNTRPWETKTSQDHDDHQVPVSVPLVPHVRSSLSGVGSALSGESSFSATPPSCLESSSSDLPRFPTAPPLSSPSCQYHTTSPAECRPLEPLSLSGPTGYPPSSALSKAAGTPRPCMKRRIVKYLPNFLTYFRLGASVILFLSLFYPNLIFSRCGFEADVAASTAESSQRLWFRSSLSSKEATHPLQFSLSLLGTASPLSPCSPSLSSFTLHDTSPGSSKAASPSEEQSCFFPLVPSPPHHVAPSPLFSAGLFVLASVTDFLDGYLARKFNVCSPVGALLDALTDKLLVSAALGGICSLAVPPFSRVLGPPATIIFMREIAVQGLRLHLEKMNRGSEGEVQWLGKVKTALQMVSVSFLLLLLPLYTRSPQSMPAPLFLPPVSSVMTQLSSSLWGRSSVSEAVNGSTGKAGPGEQFWTRTRRKDFGSSWEPQSGSATYVVCSRLKGRKYSPSSSRPHDLDQLSLPLTGSLSLSTGTEAEEAPAEKQEMDAVCAPFFGVGRSSTRVGTMAHTLKKALPAAATAMLRYGWKPTGLGSEACALVYGRFSASVRTLREKLRSGGLRLWQERIAIKGRNLVSLEGCRLPRPCARSLLGKTSSILRNRAMALGKSRAAHWCGSISLGIKASLRCTLSADGLPTALTYSVLGLWGAAFLAVISGGLYFRRATSGKKKETA